MSYDKYILPHKYNITSNIICICKYADKANIYMQREALWKFHPKLKSELSLFSTFAKTSSQPSDIIPFQQDIAKLNLRPEVISSCLQKEMYK